MLPIDALRMRLERILDESLAEYPDIKLSPADKVKLLSEWEDEMSKTCASVQELFDAMDLDKIIIDRVIVEYQAIEVYYDGHFIDEEEAYLMELFQNTLDFYDALLAYKVKRDECHRILREFDEAFKIGISHALHGSSLST
ncbi:hypothetical protein NW768_005145 [Fusarium equiseti]|uniref:Uncharacterized protein n=1 Tax=Fusarium equiseti TaxID=61235 RepID=A0ABQ8RF16_FUSEQ|nr:hypothetical protein NW768_005145 [Fusarium equiseti]